jgi:hypothetical protein
VQGCLVPDRSAQHGLGFLDADLESAQLHKDVVERSPRTWISYHFLSPSPSCSRAEPIFGQSRSVAPPTVVWRLRHRSVVSSPGAGSRRSRAAETRRQGPRRQTGTSPSWDGSRTPSAVRRGYLVHGTFAEKQHYGRGPSGPWCANRLTTSRRYGGFLG